MNWRTATHIMNVLTVGVQSHVVQRRALRAVPHCPQVCFHQVFIDILAVFLYAALVVVSLKFNGITQFARLVHVPPSKGGVA